MLPSLQTIHYDVQFGAGYYLNLKRLYGDLYRGDVVHKTSAGWTMDHDVTVTVPVLKGGTLTVALTEEEKVATGLFYEITIKFSHAKIK